MRGESVIIHTFETTVNNQVSVSQFSPDHIEHRSLPVLPRPVDGEILACVYQALHCLESFGGVHHVVPLGITAAGYVEFFPHIRFGSNKLQKYIFFRHSAICHEKGRGQRNAIFIAETIDRFYHQNQI